MSNVKDFGLVGVGSTVQWAKGGSRIKTTGSAFNLRDAADGADVALTAAGITSSAGNITLTTGNVVLTSTAGTISIGGDTTMQRAAAGIFQFNGTAAIIVPVGLTGEEPAATAGSFRYNSTTGFMEFGNGSVWQPLSSGGGSVANLAGGTAGQVPYQSAPSTTAFTGPGTSGQVLTSNGTSAPTYTAIVNSLTGTANQVSVSSATGAVTLSLPSAMIAPGSLQVTSQFVISASTISAAGSIQSDATLVTTSYSHVTAVGAGQGVRLPAPLAVGEEHWFTNNGLNPLLIYPNVGSTLDGAGTNVAASLPVGQSVAYIYAASNTWISFEDANYEGTGISIVHASAGGTTFSNTGVLSFSAGSTGFTPSSPTTGVVTLAGILNPASGGTGINNGVKTITLGGNISTDGSFTTVGVNPLILTTTGSTNVTLPLSGTLATVGGTVSTAQGTAGRITVNTDASPHSGAVTVDIDSTYVGQATITTLGTVTTGTWNATTVATNHGGTGVTSFTSNGALYGNGSGNVLVTAAGTQYQVLNAGGSGVPTFDAVHLDQSAAVTGILPLVNGGTNAALTAVAGSPVYSTASALALGTAGTTGQAYISGGTGAPTWQSVASTLTTDQIIKGDGTGLFTANGGTFFGLAGYSGVTLLGTVTNATDAASKAYVDAATASLNIHEAVAAATVDDFHSPVKYVGGVAGGSPDAGFGVGATLTDHAEFIDGSVTFGTFQSGETITQTGTGATFIIRGTVPPGGPITVVDIGFSGVPDASGVWTGFTSLATFAPTSTPYYVPLMIDGYTVLLNDRVLIKDQALPASFNIDASGSGTSVMNITSVISGTVTIGQELTFADVSSTPVYILSFGTFTVTGGTGTINLTSSQTQNVEVVSADATYQNGVYVQTTLGTSSLGWVLTRASDYDNSFYGQVKEGDFVFVTNGTLARSTGWAQNSVGTQSPANVTYIGKDPITFTQFSSIGTYTAGQGLTLTGNEFTVNWDNTTIWNNSIGANGQLAVKSSGTANQTLVSAGSGSAVWGALPLNQTAAVSGALPAIHGGTGFASYTIGDTLYADTTTTLIKRAIGTNGQASVVSGGLPTWQNIVNSFQTSLSGLTPSTSSTGDITLAGTLGVSSGGTGATSLTTNGVLYGGTTVGVTAAGTTGQVLVGNTAAAPTWATVSSSLVSSFSAGTTGFTPSSPTTGAIVLSGTLNVANGGTGATTFNSNSLLVGHTTSAVTAPSNLTFLTDTLTIGTATIQGGAVDTTITATATGGSIILNPDATGSVIAGPVGDGLIQSDAAFALIVKGNTTLTLQSVDTGGSLVLSMASGGYPAIGGFYAGIPSTYSVALTSGLPGTANAIPNVQYVNDAITAATVLVGAIQSVTVTVSLASNGTTNIGAVLPTIATILATKVNVTVADTAATLIIGDTSHGAASYMLATENDPQTVGLYMAENYITGAGGQQVFATVASSAGTSGATCTVIVTYAD